MKCLVTGAAGFIGSHLSECLLREGHHVVGLDALIPYYAPTTKVQNLRLALAHPNYHFQQLDLRSDPLEHVLHQVEVVFHLAAMPGLQQSWTDFEGYSSCNVLATQRLLEAIRKTTPDLRRLVCASTSSVYGRYSSGDETLPTKPISPYGVTKLAAENLCRAYSDSYGIPLVVLRYFSVYGPRQRPDMGYHRFIAALQHGQPVVVYGDGQQMRGNTYVADCVAATVAAVQAPAGETYNVGGGENASVWDILRRLEHLAGTKAEIVHKPARPGDQRLTFADTSKLRAHLGWQPNTELSDGLARQWHWQKAAQGESAIQPRRVTLAPANVA